MQHKLDLQTVLCSNCSYVFTNPMPPPDVYDRFYVEAYAQYYGHISPAPIGELHTNEPQFVRERLDRIERIVPLEGKRVVEIGPGQGLLLHWARKRGCEVLGIEPSNEFCRALSQANIPFLNRLLLQVNPAETGHFDVLIMSHVLEHFYDPGEALEHCRRLLVRGGLLVVEVPNILKPFRSLDRFFLRYVHPCSFSPATLQAFLGQRGFRTELIDVGGTDWQVAQNIFLIASKRAERTSEVPCEQAPQEVMHALQDYRRTWKRKTVWLWMIRHLHLRLHRTARQCIRFLKAWPVFAGLTALRSSTVRGRTSPS